MRTVMILLILTATVMFGQNPTTSHYEFSTTGAKVLMLKGKVAGDLKSWLVINTYNGDQWKQNGYDPSYTRILSDYTPLFRKLPSGQWEICFTPEKIP
jgi:hypothetical protein